jgi:hypothetical protein
VVERNTSHPKGNPTKPAPSKDHFEKLLHAPCPHHEVPSSTHSGSVNS